MLLPLCPCNPKDKLIRPHARARVRVRDCVRACALCFGRARLLHSGACGRLRVPQGVERTFAGSLLSRILIFSISANCTQMREDVNVERVRMGRG